jgi:glycerol-3-phosphate dehydrogenase
MPVLPIPGLSRPPLPQGNFDVAVIGGGINGIAIARECARAGRRVLLVEQNDFGSGTTSRSTRIIHGGLRYLEHGEIDLVRQSLRERGRLLRERPHLVRPLKFLLALERGNRHSALAIRAGLWFYSRFSGWEKIHNAGSGEESRQLEAALDAGREWSIFAYDDAQCEFPERLLAEWLLETRRFGARLLNYCEVLEIDVRDHKACGMRVRDGISGIETQVRAKWIINAAGPWVDRVLARSSLKLKKPLVGGVRGSHIVLPRKNDSLNSAVYAEAADGRPIFVIPWNDQLLVGTTEIADDGDPETTAPNEHEISYLLESLRNIFPAQRWEIADVRYAFAGVRPLPYSPERGLNAGAISRQGFLHDHRDDGAAGLISLVGGKLTTAADSARQCARKIGIAVAHQPEVQVALAPADGVECSLRHWSEVIGQQAGIGADSARALAEWHGGCALRIARMAARDSRLRRRLCEHTPHIVAEAAIAAMDEQAVTLADILLRRAPVAMGACWSRDCSHNAANRIAIALRWGERETREQLGHFEEEEFRFLIQPAPATLPARAKDVA